MNNQLNIRTRGSQDTFRVIGYVVNKNQNNHDMGGNKWRLFGRQSYRGSSRGEFYLSPINNDNDDQKYHLKTYKKLLKKHKLVLNLHKILIIIKELIV